MTINLGRTKQCTIPKLHTLNPDSDGVSVREDLSDKTGMVWLVTANNKGTHDITVYDAGRPLAGKITVVVPNSLPYRDSTVDPTIDLPIATNHSRITSSIGGPTLHGYFDDPDAVDVAPFLYRIVDQPKWVLIETKDGFVVTDFDNDKIKSDTTGLRMEVLNEMKGNGTFTVSLVASDGSDESELPVVLTFQADTGGLLPRMVTDYTSTQTENGALGKTALRVGPRRGVNHTLIFTQYPGVDQFKFVADKKEGLMAHKRIPLSFVVTKDNLYYKAGSNVLNTSDPPVSPSNSGGYWVPGFNYFVLESSGVVEEPRWVGTLTDDPRVTFKLKESGGAGTITISYYMVYAKTDYPTPAKNNTAVDPASLATRVAYKSLNVTVVTCSSPPDPVDKCP